MHTADGHAAEAPGEGKQEQLAEILAQRYEGLSPQDPQHLEFGGRLAEQLGADLSGDLDNPAERNGTPDESEVAMKAAARVQDWREKLDGMDHEQRVQATLDCLGRKNNQKEILSELLAFCQTERSEAETEEFLTNHKEFANGHHSASKYLFFMQRTGGIEEREYDEDGLIIDDERREMLRGVGATEDEIADLTAEWRYVTTAAGSEALERFDPVERTNVMLASQADSRLASYQRLLAYCEQPRSLDEIVGFMADDPGLERDPKTGVMHMQPSAYIGKLDESGALTWEGGWKTTPGGMEVLETMLAQEQ